jgi:glycolate oxidase
MSRIKVKIKKQFEKQFGERLLFSKEETATYASDDGLETPNKVIALFLPINEEEVGEIVKFCYTHRIPFSVRGKGTGKTGSYNLIAPGILICMEKMIAFELYEQDMAVKVEAGVVNKVLQDFLISRGLFFPVDPASLAISSIGGNIATNAGGPRSFKYGVMGDYVLQLTVILPTGEKVVLGTRTRKNATGYPLKNLFVGSGGTLGIITSAILKVIPYPPYRILLNIGFKSINHALKAITHVYRSGICPSAIEFIEKRAFEIVEEYRNEKILIPGTNACLYIELDGSLEEEVFKLSEKTRGVLREFSQDIVYLEENIEEEAQKKLWDARRDISHATKHQSYHKRSEDIAVPPSRIQDFIESLQVLKETYGIEIVCFGHLGDGNIHLNILNVSDESGFVWNKFQYEVIEKILNLVKDNEGTLSGEHGVGLSKKKYLPLFLSSKEIEIHESIKQTLDPLGLLNPKKIW